MLRIYKGLLYLFSSSVYFKKFIFVVVVLGRTLLSGEMVNVEA